MRMSVWMIATASMAVSTTAIAADRGATGIAAAPEDAALVRLVTRDATAIATFDQRTLAEITAPDYTEISPVGDVDARAAVLGFYAPANKDADYTAQVTETTVRRSGDTALITARIVFATPVPTGETAPPPHALRGGYVARRYGTTWKLVSAQFTPIRGKPPAVKPAN